ncbi:MAG: DNA polymerase Y family protein [Cellvibrionaceae bacterium]|nr:DNA polymerase Y family protein [Cellvibrionaceae bacterium]
MLWLYLHFYQLQLDGLYHPEQASQALVIVDGPYHKICQANAPARELGIELGMGLASAAALAPQLQVLDYQQTQEQQLLQQLAGELYPISASIVLKQPQGLLLEVSSMLNYHGGLKAYWHKLQQALQAWHYHYASAYAPLAAQLLAEAGFNQLQQEQTILQKALAQLPIDCLPIASKSRQQLQRLGIRQLGRLLKLPLKELGKRFDLELLQIIGRLSQQLKTPLEYFQPAETFHEQLQLFYEISDSDKLNKPLGLLLNKLQQFLQQRDLEATCVELQLQLRQGQIEPLRIHSSQGDYRREPWQKLFALRFERLPLPAPVEALALYCGHYRRRGGQHRDLLDARNSGLSTQQLHDQLSARLGDSAVKPLAFGNSHVPELCQQDSGDSPPEPLLRPVFLLQQPEPLKDQIALHQGPERIQSHWWRPAQDGGEIERDYFIGRDQLGRWCWVFKTRRGQWFVQGYFS